MARKVVNMAGCLGLGEEQHAVAAGVYMWHLQGGRPLWEDIESMGAVYGEAMVPMELQERLEEALWGANKTALKWARRGLVGGARSSS